MRKVSNLRPISMHLLTLWLVFGVVLVAEPQGHPHLDESPLDSPREVSLRGDLRDVLGSVASLYTLPLVAVLAGETTPVELQGAFTAREILLRALAKNPGYSWEVRDSVVYVFHKNTRADPNNMLNWRISRFTISKNLAEVELRLRANLNKIRHGVKGEGGLMVGMASPSLSNHTLPTVVMEDATAEEILLRVASLDKKFYTVLAYPKEPPIQKDDLDWAFLNWKWVQLCKNP